MAALVLRPGAIFGNFTKSDNIFFELCEIIGRRETVSWGRSARRMFNKWLHSFEPAHLIYAAGAAGSIKMPYTPRDLMRLIHPVPSNAEYAAAFAFIAGREADSPTAPFYSLTRAIKIVKESTSAYESVPLIREFKLSWEHTNRALLKNANVWMTFTLTPAAFVQNLGRIIKARVPREWIIMRLAELGPVHPFLLLLAYREIEALEAPEDLLAACEMAMYAAFKHLKPTNRRIMLSLDVCGSMNMLKCPDYPGITMRDYAAFMVLVYRRVEPFVKFMVFSQGFSPIEFSEKDTLEIVINKMSILPFSFVDLSQPRIYAKNRRLEFDLYLAIIGTEA